MRDSNRSAAVSHAKNKRRSLIALPPEGICDAGSSVHILSPLFIFPCFGLFFTLYNAIILVALHREQYHWPWMKVVQGGVDQKRRIKYGK